jgi:hypothetical protein
MGDNAGILPTAGGIFALRDGDVIMEGVTTLAPNTCPPPAGLLGDICHCTAGGGVPQELLELVRLRCPNPALVGGVPSVNCTLGGDNWHMSGMGGADTLLVLVVSFKGDLGLNIGLTRACLRSSPGLWSGRLP